MFDRGINAEVLAADSLGPSSTARAAVGWDEALACDLDGLITRTWQLARRQRTWFRKMTGFDTVDITNATGEESADRVMGVLRAQAMI